MKLLQHFPKSHYHESELRPKFVFIAIQDMTLDMIDKFSKYEKLLRVYCWVRRATDQFKNKSFKKSTLPPRSNSVKKWSTYNQFQSHMEPSARVG